MRRFELGEDELDGDGDELDLLFGAVAWTDGDRR